MGKHKGQRNEILCEDKYLLLAIIARNPSKLSICFQLYFKIQLKTFLRFANVLGIYFIQLFIKILLNVLFKIQLIIRFSEKLKSSTFVNITNEMNLFINQILKKILFRVNLSQ